LRLRPSGGPQQVAAIHAAFAAQCGQDLSYEAILAPLDGFADSLCAFVAAGGRGANVTVPFKEEACRLATRLTPRAARRVRSTRWFSTASGMLGDNTDGAGLLRDLTNNLGLPYRRTTPAPARRRWRGARRRRALARGPAGGAGHCQPYCREGCRSCRALCRNRRGRLPCGCGYPELAGQSFDLVINATSASLGGEAPYLPVAGFRVRQSGLRHDVWVKARRHSWLLARAQGAARLADGLGMLVEQAAEAFHFWRGVLPDSAPVMATAARRGPAG
jgi:shikimate dehydrogenase